ncbi:sensor histidine kinase [Alteromonas sp. NFXS44]|uniref:sensor histidine kinase n=1 Tax=Alteromonas sp. NFXS44 TaxID=2818435 RepID=UPI0032DEB5FC
MSSEQQTLIDDILRQQQYLRNRLDEEQQQLTLMAKRLWAQQEADKANLSRELHDGVGQLLTALTRRLHTLSAADPKMAELAELANLALEDVRQLSRMMSPVILDDLGLKPALKWLCRSLFEEEAIQCRCEITINCDISKDISTLIFRIAQEALTNTLKHSEAELVTVRLQNSYNTIRLEISDNGKGFQTGRVKQGVGLTSIADRARAFDATLEIASASGGGTTTTVVIPL